MKVAVYDSYVTRRDGKVMHFDIVVPETVPHHKALEFGKEYLKRAGQEGQPLTATESQFCHVEEAGPDIEQSIRVQGFHIHEMEGCTGEPGEAKE